MKKILLLFYIVSTVVSCQSEKRHKVAQVNGTEKDRLESVEVIRQDLKGAPEGKVIVSGDSSQFIEIHSPDIKEDSAEAELVKILLEQGFQKITLTGADYKAVHTPE